MGYSEVVCHICGVSFNIGRIRTAIEPRKAAWARYGCGPFGGYSSCVDGHRSCYYGECSRDSGCGFALRAAKDKGIGFRQDKKGRQLLDHDRIVASRPVQYIGSGDDTEADGSDDYVCESPAEDELEYHYESDDIADNEDDTSDDAVLQPMDCDGSDDGPDDPDLRHFWYDSLVLHEDARKTLEKHDDHYLSWYDGRPDWLPIPGEPSDAGDEIFPLFYPRADGDTASEHGSDGSFEPPPDAKSLNDHDQRRLHRDHGKLGYTIQDRGQVEHIAGPGCASREGYNGNNITAEEMQGCLTVQCLVRKPPTGALVQYHSESDDLQFEREGDFFLSGLSDRMPSRDDNHPLVFPPRHGCERPYAENPMWEDSTANEYAMPFHPSCLEVYKQVSRLRSPLATTIADIEGLTSWWTMEASYDPFHSTDSHYNNQDVKACGQQDWDHKNGTEWLVANPLFVPALPSIFTAAIEDNPSFDPHNGAFDIPTSSTSMHLSTRADDPFARLPHELLLQILSNLPSSSIAALRLSSRTLTQLPVSFFQILLNREMPWLWEAQPSLSGIPYSMWACTTASVLKNHTETLARRLRDTEDYLKIIRTEMPELLPTLHEAQTELNATLIAEHESLREQSFTKHPFTLPAGKTNWFTLYTLLARSLRRGELKGLRNRERIWRCCEEILTRIERYRADIDVEFPVKDVGAVIRRNNEAAKKKREAWEEQRRREREATMEREKANPTARRPWLWGTGQGGASAAETGEQQAVVGDDMLE